MLKNVSRVRIYCFASHKWKAILVSINHAFWKAIPQQFTSYSTHAIRFRCSNKTETEQKKTNSDKRYGLSAIRLLFFSVLLESQSIWRQPYSPFSLKSEIFLCTIVVEMSYKLFIDSDDEVDSCNLSSDTVEYRQPCSQARVLQRRLQSAWGGNRRSNSFSMSKTTNPPIRFPSSESNSLPSSPDRLKSVVNQFSFVKFRNSVVNPSESAERLNEHFFEKRKPIKVQMVNR